MNFKGKHTNNVLPRQTSGNTSCKLASWPFKSEGLRLDSISNGRKYRVRSLIFYDNSKSITKCSSTLCVCSMHKRKLWSFTFMCQLEQRWPLDLLDRQRGKKFCFYFKGKWRKKWINSVSKVADLAIWYREPTIFPNNLDVQTLKQFIFGLYTLF